MKKPLISHFGTLKNPSHSWATYLLGPQLAMKLAHTPKQLYHDFQGAVPRLTEKNILKPQVQVLLFYFGPDSAQGKRGYESEGLIP